MRRTNNQSLAVSDCVASWSDICGFGYLLEQNQWNLNELQSNGIVKLIADFHRIAGKPLLINIAPLPHDKVIVLNDGLAHTVVLSNQYELEGISFLIFIRDLIVSHYLLLAITKSYNVGIRTTLAGGERIQYSSPFITGHSSLYYDAEKLSDFGRDLLDTTFVYNPSEFQLNTAFAKAYTIDSLGTKHNIQVNGLYIEKSFFDKANVVKDLNISIQENHILIFLQATLVFSLKILETLPLIIKGLPVIIYHIERLDIYKAFDGDDVTFELFK